MGRLIDEDDVMRMLTGVELNNGTITSAKIELRNVKTAYDVDKVVAELERKIKDTQKVIVTPPQDKLDEIANDTAKDFIGAWKSAIKVVRKGGVSESQDNINDGK